MVSKKSFPKKKSSAPDDQTFHLMFERHSAVMLLIDPQTGTILNANQAALNFYGYPKSKLCGMTIQEINTLPPEQVAAERQKTFNDERNYFIFPHKLASGEERIVEVYSSPIALQETQVLFSIIHDITERKQAENALQGAHAELEQRVAERTEGLRAEIAERKQAEDALRESEEWHRAILQTAMDGFWQVDMQGRLLEVNDAYCRMSGYSAQELLSMRIIDLDAAETNGDTAAHIQKIMAQGDDRFETRHRRKDGSIFDIEISVQFRPAEGGRMVAFLRDISERKQAEEITKEKVLFQKTLIDSIPSPVFYKDAQGRYLGFNKSYLEFFGKAESQLVGKTVYEVSPGELADVYHRMDTELFNGSGTQIYESQVRDARGQLHDVIFHKAAFYDTHGILGGLIGVILDITGRKQAEAALQESEKRYRTLVNTSPDAIFYFSPDMRVILCNQRAAELYGVENPAGMLGMSAFNLFGPENHSWITAEIARFPKGWSVRGQELTLSKKDGSHFPAEVGASLVVNEMDEPVGIISVIRDITQRKQLEQYLMRTERLTAMGKISAELAHEIRNPLHSIQSNLELVLDFDLDPDESRQHLRMCFNELERLINLTNRLLNLANPNKTDLQPVSVPELFQSTLALVEKSSKDVGVNLNLVVPDGFPLLQVELDQMIQVLLNLCKNAIEAMPLGGQLTISAEAADESIRLNVINDGNIIPASRLELIFEPFYTTKSGGTGLGLPISYNIIQKMGGSLNADNLHDPDRVKFTITFPASICIGGQENAS